MPAAPAASAGPAPRRAKSKVVLSALVMTFAAGLVATIALPSYAVNPAQQQSSVAGRAVTKTGQQQYRASEDLAAVKISRDKFEATSSATLLRQQYATQFASYSGPSAADFLKNPAHPPFSLDAVFNTALQYRGVPYVFGGADPSGFDCSGFIMFVYAQYGVSLPHSVHAQDGIGTPISQADAQPGDVVIFNDDSHDGFYAGNGMILHAPYPGAKVRVQKLWTTAVHFERFGI
ncbi:C40 family peptidase [Amnibacterium kyonggiense]|uniref:NlpC/P60 family protein n=1 Tax=Amnibacterium kyonggiense TaxID=595671 RepID=A0A4R7FRF8_9MICO|nr:C40 family peptidase [Amnibacterium kyonggiense]TDS80415.1 NlpC/P60 family protein [Amnibacterium kyonggiense]